MSSLGIFNKETKTYQKVAGDVGAAILDKEMSDTSENPVQNKVIKKYVDSKQVEVPIAGTGKAGIVKPADGLTVEEDGTLKVKLDGTTLTMDQVNNVIKLADTLKEKINGALPAANVVNNLTTTEAGFALDARQANPNIDGTLAKQLSELSGSLKGEVIVKPVESPFTGNVAYVVKNGICMVSLWDISAPTGALGNVRLVADMPDAAMHSGVLGESSPGATDSGVFIFIDPGMKFIGCHKAEGCALFYASFSYPVKL